MPTWYACVWRAPFTTVQLLAELEPTVGSSAGAYPFAITPDGATVVGTAHAVSDSSWRAVRWNTATGAITELERVVSPNACAIAVSNDGSKIVGGGGALELGTDGPNGDVTTPLVWGSGGTTGSLLPPTGSGPTHVTWPDWSTAFRRCSDDGSVVPGFDGSDPLTLHGAKKWISGVNTDLPGPGTSIVTDSGPGASCVSPDGTIVLGNCGAHNAVTNVADACYWVGTTLHRLVVPAEFTGTNGGPNALLCNSDVSVIWGEAVDTAYSTTVLRSFYWDDVPTLDGDGIHYGVSHLMEVLPNDQSGGNRIFWVADDPEAHVAVGRSPIGETGTHACKWVGTAITDLVGIDAAQNSEAWGCNHDGTVIAGWAFDSGFSQWPVRWDASNTLHVLPTLPGATLPGLAFGVSRDGSVIFGIVGAGDDPPPTPARLAMDNVVCTTEAPLSQNLISLDWSDDRGHSFGNPVSQSMGEAGEYRTSVQFQRLGMARDRVFRLSWSVAAPTALQGCFVDVTPAES
jgi:uncharacterized membrane protein